jgi:hypothetical protein
MLERLPMAYSLGVAHGIQQVEIHSRSKFVHEAYTRGIVHRLVASNFVSFSLLVKGFAG